MSSGFLLVNKPAGITSHDVVDRLRKITGIRKIGHAGTLDPFATGLLLVAVGRDTTKRISEFVGLPKEYLAEIILGATTETLDPEGEVIRDPHISICFDREPIESAVATLTGNIKQIPPMYSAIKKGGKKLYELARKGQTIEREPRDVSIYTFDLLENPCDSDGLTHVRTRVQCSSGTYIRALARDLGAALGTTGYLIALERTAIGEFKKSDAVDLETLTSETWQTYLRDLN